MYIDTRRSNWRLYIFILGDYIYIDTRRSNWRLNILILGGVTGDYIY